MTRSPRGRRERDVLKLKVASHPLAGGTTNWFPRAACPATGCEAICRSMARSWSDCPEPTWGIGLRSGTARPNRRVSTVNGLLVWLSRSCDESVVRNGLNSAESLSVLPWKSE